MNFFLKVFFILGTLITVLINTRNRNNMTLRIAFPYDKDISFYEPTRIHLAPEYIFLENIYSPLIELDPKEGIPSAAIAEHYDWRSNELHLYIRKDLVTIDGHQITAYDAEFSLKRLLILASNTHGNFKSIICPDDKIEKIEDKCDGINVIDKYHLVLETKGRKQFLAKMIAAIDFAIIPIESVDPVSLKIIDYRNTSGPFYVEKSDDIGNIELKANPKHYHYSTNIPQIVKLIPAVLSKGISSIELYSNNKVDHITTIDDIKANRIIDFSKNDSSAFLHSSMNLRTFSIFFTEKGLRRLSRDERVSIGKLIRKSFEPYFLEKSGYEKRHQLFPSFGDGGLNSQEMEVIDQVFDNNNIKITKNISITTIRVGAVDEFQKLLKKYSNIKIKNGKVSDVFGGNPNDDNFPDLFIGGPDVSFMEDVGLISYTVNAGLIGIKKENREEWLKNYMEVADKSERMQLLKAVHKKALLNAYLVPYASSPYVAILRKGWTSDLPEIVGNNLLWKITKD